jgi:Asp-tRNA(Asn)/Glu-tRNA(Gln) amidotransferase A subunit family amidase
MVASVESDFDDETLGPRELNGAPVDPCFGWCLTYPANSIDCPAISVPVGLAEEGPSVVIRLIVPRFKDTTVLALPQRVQRGDQPTLSLPHGERAVEQGVL